MTAPSPLAAARPLPLLLAMLLGIAASGGGACGGGPPTIDLGGEGEGDGEGEGEGEVALIEASNDTCGSPIVLEDGVAFSMPGFTATATRHNCSATNDVGDDGIEDLAFSFVLSAAADVTITANGDQGDGETYASPTLTLFDTPLCAFPVPKVVDDRTCVGDGLTFDAPTVMTLTALPAGTWYVVAETFGDLVPFSIVVDVRP